MEEEVTCYIENFDFKSVRKGEGRKGEEASSASQML